MKLSNLFQKNTNTVSTKLKAESLSKTQLAKVIGGAETETVIISPEKRGVEKSQIE